LQRITPNAAYRGLIIPVNNSVRIKTQDWPFRYKQYEMCDIFNEVP